MKAGPVTWLAASSSLSSAWPGAPRSGIGLNSMCTDPTPHRTPSHLVLSTAMHAETAPPMTPISGEFPGPSTLLMEGGVGKMLRTPQAAKKLSRKVGPWAVPAQGL